MKPLGRSTVHCRPLSPDGSLGHHVIADHVVVQVAADDGATGEQDHPLDPGGAQRRESGPVSALASWRLRHTLPPLLVDVLGAAPPRVRDPTAAG